MGKIMMNGVPYASTYDNSTSVKYSNTKSKLNATNVQDAIDEVVTDLQKDKNNFTNYKNNISNPNLFINGNFQIWSNGERFEVYGTNNEDFCTTICDRWRAKHYDIVNDYVLEKTPDGILFTSDSTEPCYVYQMLDEETFSALQGKILTLSYSYTQDDGEIVEESRQIGAGSELDVFTAQTRISLTSGCVLHWMKLEVGEMHTPCVPDSKDAIICKLEKRMVKTYSGENSRVGTGGWITYSVTFPEPFTEIPLVTVMQTSLTSNENIALKSVSREGLTYEVYAQTTTFEYKSRWMAIGY